MKLYLLNKDKFVEVNDLKEITNPIALGRGFIPTPDGVLSQEIFGTSTRDRKMTFAYIDLNCHLLQPIIYKTLKRLDRRIDNVLMGDMNFKIDKDGQLAEDENGDTGIDWLYNNWNKIKWKRNESKIRSQRIDLLELHSKDELFQSKEIVCPAFYRDVNLQSASSGKPSVHIINSYYTKLIQLASMLNQGYRMQQTLVQIYDEFKNRVEKKRGAVKQAVLGKSVDYGARLVISTTKFTANRPSDMLVDFTHAGIPLGYCISLFTPFFVGWIQRFFQNEFERTGYKIPNYDSVKKQLHYTQVKDPLIQFNDETIHHMMKTYIRSASERFDPILVETIDGNKLPMTLQEKMQPDADYNPDTTDNPLFKRYFTLTDLFYLAAVDITADKHVYITRYPIADASSVFPCGISVLSTNETMKVTYDGKEYTHYPVVDLKMEKSKVPTQFIEVLNMSNTLLQGIGGDYDGKKILLSSKRNLTIIKYSNC